MINLNTRILAYPHPDKPLSLLSIESKPIKETDFENMLEVGRGQLEKLANHVKKEPLAPVVVADHITASHLRLIATKLEEGTISREQVLGFTPDAGGFCIQIYLS
jgi:hypothetical protein